MRTVQPAVEYVMEEYKISLDEPGLYRWDAEMRQKTVVFQRGAPVTGVGSQPHQKPVLEPLKPSEVCDSSAAPDNTSVLYDQSDMRVKRT